jgi:hypothetical protein
VNSLESPGECRRVRRVKTVKSSQGRNSNHPALSLGTRVPCRNAAYAAGTERRRVGTLIDQPALDCDLHHRPAEPGAPGIHRRRIRARHAGRVRNLTSGKAQRLWP